MTSMSFCLLVIMSTLVLLFASSDCEPSLDGIKPEVVAASDANQMDAIKRNTLIPPELMDFKHYLQVFNKRYPSLLEFVSRQRLFLKRVFQVFLSFISFKEKAAPIYLSTNRMSDWTDSEIRSVYMDASAFNKRYEMDPSRSDGRTRSKRSVVELDADQSWQRAAQDVTLQSLMSDPARFGQQDHDRARIVSNNPHYVAPDVISYGADNEDTSVPAPINSEEVAVIINDGFFTNLIGAYKSTTAKIHHLSSLVNDPNYSEQNSTPVEHLADEVFVDHTSCFVAPKSQRTCGSCYIFSTVALFEWRYCKETGVKASFSEQYPLDCGARTGLGGCSGGFVEEVIGYTGQFGLEVSFNYPYRSQADQCPYESSVQPIYMGYIKPIGASYQQIPFERQDLIEMALSEEPLAIGLKTSGNFPFYANGIDDGGSCDGFAHAMVLVGHGRQDNQEYWLIRNSHGIDWGIAGYYKLSKKFNCWLAPATKLLSRFNTPSEHINSFYHSDPIKKRFLNELELSLTR